MNTISRPRRRLRTALAAALATVGLLALTGCMKVDMDLTLSSDDTVSGSVVMAVSNQLAETMGMEPGELWDQGASDLGADLPEGATQEPYSDDDYTGTKYTFTDAPLEDFAADESDQLSITRDGDDYVVAGTMDMTDTSQIDSLPQGVQDAFDIRIAVTFPGAVDAAATNGTIEGTTVTWTPRVGEANELQARGAADAGSDFPWWIVGLAVGILVLVLVVWLVVRSQRSGKPAVAGETTPQEQIFGARPEAPAAPGTGPVPEPFEPNPEPASDTRTDTSTDTSTDTDTGRRPTDPPQGA